MDADVTLARARFERLVDAYRGRSGVARERAGERDALIVDSKAFASLEGDRLTVLLPAGPHGTSSEWLPIDAEPQWHALADEAYQHVARSTGASARPGAVVVDPHELAEGVAEAFDLGRPHRPMTPGSPSSQETWRLDTDSGSFLVKRFWRGPELPWRVSLERTMEFEAVALNAGIDSPPPIMPRTPQFAAAASIDGLGVFRAYPYLEHRSLELDDDITDWYAATLARIQQLEPPLAHAPAPPWWYSQFPSVPVGQWRSWLDEGRRLGRPWVGAMVERIDTLVELTNRVVEAFAAGAPWVMSHRDVETWNILMVSDSGGWRPMLVDWDVAGPDSAALEAAHVLTEYATFGRESPDADRLRRGIEVYRGEGGAALDAATDILARRIGMRVAHIAARVRSSLGATSADVQARADAALLDYLESLPGFVADVAERARMF